MSATTRLHVLLTRLERSCLRLFGVHGGAPSFALDNVSMEVENKTSNSSQSALKNIFESLLYAVPKSRRSLERRLTRRMGGKGHFESYGRPKNNIVACLECGHWYESNTICGNCYEKVREETNVMREAMGEEANFYSPQKEVKFVYSGEKPEDSTDRFVVEMKKTRPTWFSKALLSKLPQKDNS